MALAASGSRGFLLGIVAGVATSLLALWVLSGAATVDPAAVLLESLWQQAQRNLQGAILPFAALLLAYAVLLQRLAAALQSPAPELAGVLRLDQLTDLSATLFFGVGVIWTAVGMRAALLFALGDPQASVGAGAFTVLQRLVEGGILLALSTTIVGGIGGYLMRMLKTLWLGAELNGVYLRQEQQQMASGLASLQRIEELLKARASAADTLNERAD